MPVSAATHISDSAAADEADSDDAGEAIDITTVEAESLLRDDLEHQGIQEFINSVLQSDMKAQGMLP